MPTPEKNIITSVIDDYKTLVIPVIAVLIIAVFAINLFNIDILLQPIAGYVSILFGFFFTSIFLVRRTYHDNDYAQKDLIENPHFTLVTSILSGIIYALLAGFGGTILNLSASQFFDLELYGLILNTLIFIPITVSIARYKFKNKSRMSVIEKLQETDKTKEKPETINENRFANIDLSDDNEINTEPTFKEKISKIFNKKTEN